MNNVMNGTETLPSKKTLVFPCLITVLAATCLVAAFFLPLVSARGEYREQLKEYAKAMDELDESLEKTGKEIEDKADINLSDISILTQIGTNAADMGMDISVYNMAKVYWPLVDNWGDVWSIVIIIFFAGPGVAAAITLLFALFKKPIAVMFFNLFSLGTSFYVTAAIETNADYGRGIACYLYPIGTAIVFIGAIWMLVVKIQRKRKIKALRKISE